MRTTSRKSAFSLVEIAIALSIIGFLLSASLIAGRNLLARYKMDTAHSNVDAISTAIETFYQERGYYPCPAIGSRSSSDSDYGDAVGSCNTNTCPSGLSCSNDIVIGTVPFSTLGIHIKEDPWNNKFTYAVDKRLTDRDDGVCILRGSAIIQGESNNNITDKAAYAVFSHGPGENGVYGRNGGAASTCDTSRKDHENCNGNRTFRQLNVIADDFTSIMKWKNLDSTITPKTRGLRRHRKPHQIAGHIYTYIAGESSTAIPSIPVESIVVRFNPSGAVEIRGGGGSATGQYSISADRASDAVRAQYHRQTSDTRASLDRESSDSLTGLTNVSYIYDENDPEGGIFHDGEEVTSWDTEVGDLRHLRDFLVVNQEISTSGVKGAAFFDRPISDFEREEVESYFAKCAP